MGGGLESRCVGRVVRVVPCDARHHSHRTHDTESSVQKSICCNSKSNAPDDGRMCPKHVELRINQ